MLFILFLPSNPIHKKKHYNFGRLKRKIAIPKKNENKKRKVGNLASTLGIDEPGAEGIIFPEPAKYPTSTLGIDEPGTEGSLSPEPAKYPTSTFGIDEPGTEGSLSPEPTKNPTSTLGIQFK